MTDVSKPLARLYRYVDTLPRDTLCVFYPEQNLLIINKAEWLQLEPHEQREIERNPRTVLVKRNWDTLDAA